MKHIIKRHGHEESYDARKIYASVYAAAVNSHHEKEDAEKIADQVGDAITEWIEQKPEVTSEEVFKETVRILKTVHEDTAFMYETHRDLS